MESRVLLWILISVAVLALVGIVMFLLLPKEFLIRIRGWIKQLFGVNEESPRKVSSPEETSRVESLKQEIVPSASENSNEDKAKEQFVLKQEKFFGIYENLYLVAKAGVESSQCNLEDWNIRIRSLSGAQDLQAYWEAVRPHPEQFLTFVYSCGVMRDENETIQATEQTCYRYFLLDGTPIEQGQTYKVMQPCWTNGDVILEKGIINNI